jgi:hypothetical protein
MPRLVELSEKAFKNGEIPFFCPEGDLTFPQGDMTAQKFGAFYHHSLSLHHRSRLELPFCLTFKIDCYECF